MSIIFKEAANQAAVDRLNAVFERLTKLNWFQQAGNTDEKAEVQFENYPNS